MKRLNLRLSCQNALVFIDPAHQDKIRRWIVRILLEFIRLEEFEEEKILRFVGVDDQNIQEGFGKAFDTKLLRLELIRLRDQLNKTPQLEDKSILSKNLQRLRSQLGISQVERDLLEFGVLIFQVKILDDTLDLLGGELNSRQVIGILSRLLGHPYEEVRRAFSGESLLGTALLKLDWSETRFFRNKLDFVSYSIPDRLYSEELDINKLLSDILSQGDAPTLGWSDYDHLKKPIKVLRHYLKESLKEGRTGVNILLYGPPGTGKSELARLLGVECGAELFEVSQSDEDGDPIEGEKRLRAYRSAQALLSQGRYLLLYDEAEDIFESHRGAFVKVRQRDKAWINRTLERNPVPTIWITNRIDTLDPAIVRRFDLSLELPIPPRKVRRKILERTCGKILDERQIRRVSHHPHIAPSLISSAAKVASRLPEAQRGKELLRILDQTLQAQGHLPIKHYRKKKKKKRRQRLPGGYDPSLLTIDIDPGEFTEGLKRHPNARLCFYGPPGTGKSALGYWLAQILKRPILLKKGSDLLSMWVGGTERNIAEAFAEARKKKAVLIFDEVDSFLRDRRGAQRSWEVSQVNEMLVQMEEFDGIFIATTNLMEGLDQASLRRFDMKLEFGWLRADAAAELFAKECTRLKLNPPSGELTRRIKNLKTLTPGDFASVVRQHRFRPIASAREFLQRLERECALKESQDKNRVGFLK